MAPPASMATPSPSASAASPHPAVLRRRRTRAVLCFLYCDQEPPRPRVSSTSSLQRPRGAELLSVPMMAASPAPSFPAAGVQVPRPHDLAAYHAVAHGLQPTSSSTVKYTVPRRTVAGFHAQGRCHLTFGHAFAFLYCCSLHAKTTPVEFDKYHYDPCVTMGFAKYPTGKTDA
ncbi:hypothetical protein ACQJBY_001349 [Aegilops geniculata]